MKKLPCWILFALPLFFLLVSCSASKEKPTPPPLARKVNCSSMNLQVDTSIVGDQLHPQVHMNTTDDDQKCKEEAIRKSCIDLKKSLQDGQNTSPREVIRGLKMAMGLQFIGNLLMEEHFGDEVVRLYGFPPDVIHSVAMLRELGVVVTVQLIGNARILTWPFGCPDYDSLK